MKRTDIYEFLAGLAPIQQTALAILAATRVCKKREFSDWADNWIKNRDRTGASAADMRRSLQPNAITGTGMQPVSLTRPEMRANARVSAQSAAEAAFNLARQPKDSERLLGICKDAINSAMAENPSIDLRKLTESAREIR